jgi:hypothetical protein
VCDVPRKFGAHLLEPLIGSQLQENGILYGAAGAAGVIGVIVILVVEKTIKITDLVALGMGLSNTFALSVGLLLMGFGLVEIPRELWKSQPEQLLKWLAHRWAWAAAGQRRGHAGRRGCSCLWSTQCWR